MNSQPIPPFTLDTAGPHGYRQEAKPAAIYGLQRQLERVQLPRVPKRQYPDRVVVQSTGVVRGWTSG